MLIMLDFLLKRISLVGLVVRLSSQQTSDCGVTVGDAGNSNVGIAQSTSGIAVDIGKVFVGILTTQVSEVPVVL